MGEERDSRKLLTLNIYKQLLSKMGEMSLSMRIKFFIILVVLITTVILGVLVILTVTGTFTSGLREAQREVKEQLVHTSKDVGVQYGQLSIQAIELSRGLSASIEKMVEQHGITIDDLKNHPEILEEVVGGEYDRCMFALQRAKSSGVFLILDATVNPSLKGSENSRSGLYIKNSEPDIINSTTPSTLILRGPSSIGRQNSITLHPQWRMEFDVSEAPYFNRPMEEARKGNLSLSQLYYWTPSIKLPGTSENIMLCSIPLIDSKGNVFGVCGFEVSAMLFKLSHMPDNNAYRRIFCVFAPYTGDTLNTSQAFYAGGYSVRKITEVNQKLNIKYSKALNSYKQENKTLFKGFHVPVTIYPRDSVFSGETWAVALMMPESDISASVMRANLRMLYMIWLLLVLGIICSYYLSRKYIMPITKTIEIIKSNNFDEAWKTNIAEIDDLMEFLSANREKNKPEEKVTIKKEERLESSLFDEFVRNTKTLSPAERAVFNLYVEGYTAKEITDILCLSINTIKTHNKRIYMKLNVASRDELLAYVNMLKEAGHELK